MNLDFKITEILTLPISIMAAISLASGILLFSPLSFLERLFMTEFREQNGFIVGIVFLVSTSILVVNLSYKLVKSAVEAKNRRDFYADAEKNLKKLTDYQKAIVYTLFQEDNHTANLPLHDGAIAVLSQKFIIGQVSGKYMVEDLNTAEVPYLLQPWVADEIQNKPSLSTDFKNAFNRQIEKISNTYG
ncbi:hypothetical protein FQV26_10445 [Planococcus sp. CPCC 101016]|uniref:superinfection exclusion B family protein n=1 Tax=Planococcus sp. CPCC 101016 TaxID=2599617 RepID=UPI0011B67BCD|nr:superinfection exclusion B family protein [Planococcus sp. CPCC 101016]TWT08203.1 hypothetical protein FQV26_10445 [Planococcus sp. CPCC 101016]